jgi:hypothetical protein
MGNRTTSLDLGPIFDEPLPQPETSQSFVIRVKLPFPVTHAGQKYEESIYLSCTSTNVSVLREDSPALLEFEPHSHLRDFEVLDPFSTKEKTIPRWGAIGQICIAAFQMPRDRHRMRPIWK